MDLETTIFVLDAQVCIPLSPVFSKDEGEGHQFTDEPTGNLDSQTSQEVLGLFRAASRKFHQTLVMITHNEEIAQVADRTIRIEDGKIAESGWS